MAEKYFMQKLSGLRTGIQLMGEYDSSEEAKVFADKVVDSMRKMGYRGGAQLLVKHPTQPNYGGNGYMQVAVWGRND